MIPSWGSLHPPVLRLPGRRLPVAPVIWGVFSTLLAFDCPLSAGLLLVSMPGTHEPLRLLRQPLVPQHASLLVCRTSHHAAFAPERRAVLVGGSLDGFEGFEVV